MTQLSDGAHNTHRQSPWSAPSVLSPCNSHVPSVFMQCRSGCSLLFIYLVPAPILARKRAPSRILGRGVTDSAYGQVSPRGFRGRPQPSAPQEPTRNRPLLSTGGSPATAEAVSRVAGFCFLLRSSSTSDLKHTKQRAKKNPPADEECGI